METMSPAMTDAERIAQEFKEFTYLISHDFGAPVRGMVEFSRLLKAEYENALNEEGRLYLSLIIDNGQKLQAMLAALLDYSRLDRNTATAPVDCNVIVKTCCAALQEKIIAAGADIQVQTLPVVTANPEYMTRLFSVLLDNALKFTVHGVKPLIAVAAKTLPGGTEFSVEDNGIGIDQQFHHHVFKVFKRLHADTDYPGIGIGLALAKKIIDLMGGDIWIESVQPRGTRVSFIIPNR